ncbi:hypothetical protein KR009_002258 [Drosophila setifemur]|nr:hypothetical protein KR009_002258 [Drosophila setifemur]
MSTDNPTQLLTSRDLSQLRGHLQSGSAAALATTATATTTAAAVVAAAAAHGYRALAPPANSNSNSNSTTTTAGTGTGAGAGGGAPPVISNMPASGSKFVFLQHNHNGRFTLYDGTEAAATGAGSAGGAGSAASGGAGVGGTGSGGNIVLLAAEPLEMGAAEVLAAPSTGDDGELSSLSWLNDSNLIKGIVTTSGGAAGAAAAAAAAAGGAAAAAAAGAAANKRGTAVALKTTNGSTQGSVCIVSDLIEEIPPSSQLSDHPTEQEHPSVAGAAVYSTTTVHKGPSGTTTVVEYKASKQQPHQHPPTTTGYQRTTLVGHTGYLAGQPPSSTSLSPAKQHQQQQQQQQIFVTSSGAGAGIYKALSSPTSNTSNSNTTTSTSSSSLTSLTSSSSPSPSTTSHHPHKKYLREKMHVQMDHSSHPVASTVTVVSSPASSNNSSIGSSSSSSCSASNSVSGSGSSTAAVNGGNSPVPKGASSFSTVFEAVSYATTVTSLPSSIASASGHIAHQPEIPSAVTLISSGSLPPGYSYVNHVASTPHVISTPAHVASPETAPGAALLPGSYYSTANTTTTSTGGVGGSTISTAVLHPRGLQLSVSPPPPPMTPTNHNVHNGSGLGSGQGVGVGLGGVMNVGGANSNLRSPNSYTSYENEDSLKEFDLVVSSRMHTSTPQYGGGSKAAANGYGSGNSTTNSTSTPQKQKHPNNVPYDPLVHTNNKPPYSFSSLIFMAIEGSNEKALPVKEIYAWIVQHFPYFKTAPNGWKNSVRHNLSLNKSFVKVEKAPNMGKGSLWRVEPQQRQNLIQALNRSPFFSNSAVDKISPSLKSPTGGGSSAYDSLDGGAVISSAQAGAGGPGAGVGGAGVASAPGSVPAVALTTPSKSNGLVMANGASQSQNAAIMPHSPGGGGGGGGGGGSGSGTGSGTGGSHARFDPKLFPNLSKAFRNIREDSILDDDLPGEYHNNNNNNNNINNGGKYNYVGLNGAGAGVTGAGSGAGAGTGPGAATEGGINFERLARDCGADSMDDVNAAAAMLCLKHGAKAFSESFQNGSAPVITSSPSEDHTYSAGGNSNADSGASTPLTNGHILLAGVPQTDLQAGQHNQGGEGGSDSNCASSDAAYDSSEENHNITPEERADRQRQRDGVDALLSLSRSSNVDCGSVATSHYHSNGSSGSSHGSPHKRASSHSLEEEHREHREHFLQQHQQQRDHHFANSQAIYTNGSGSKMALLSSAAANVAQQHQDLYSSPGSGGGGSGGGGGGGSSSNLYLQAAGVSGGMLPQHLSAAMAAAAAAAATKNNNKVKPLRGIRTKIKRKSAWMR